MALKCCLSAINDKSYAFSSSINDKMCIFAPDSVKRKGIMTKDLIKLLIIEYQAYVTQVEFIIS